jgi:hypothetical protein
MGVEVAEGLMPTGTGAEGMFGGGAYAGTTGGGAMGWAKPTDALACLGKSKATAAGERKSAASSAWRACTDLSTTPSATCAPMR